MLKADKFKQLKAIEESIAKWEEKEIFAKKADRIELGIANCPLCLLNFQPACPLCPIVIYGESKGIKCKYCRNTPFYKVSDVLHYNRPLLLKAIREEILFLKKVLTFWKKRYRLYKTKEK